MPAQAHSQVATRQQVACTTFWFQAVCQNHIVWDATEVVEITRKHTAGVHDALRDVRRAIESLVTKRDERRDRFARVMKKAMIESLGTDAEEVEKVLQQKGIHRQLAKEALQIAREQGRFTIFALVDALTRIAQKRVNAGERLEADQQAASLLALAA